VSSAMTIGDVGDEGNMGARVIVDEDETGSGD
jgi:hypothetical protein